mmetsp:Transcript_1885/g.4283  ORF Transcript_1885/g.4283 Transcript_1885/m.4283 type:complete len:275 (+) Transcript_1885:175-999(+)
MRALLAGKIRVISDGSYKNHVGSACSQILTADGHDIIWITCQTPGHPDDQSSTRSELIGLLASLLVLSWMAQLVQLRLFGSKPAVEMACDGLVALRKSFDERHLKPTEAQFDLASTIREVLRKLPLELVPRHVRGHSDKKTSCSRLDFWQLRNIEVDARAQAHRRHLETTGQLVPANPRFFDEPVALFLEGVKVSKIDPARIAELITLPPLQAYWSRKHRLTHLTSPEVDWLSVGRAMNALPPRLQRWTSKHTVGMCGDVWGCVGSANSRSGGK